MKKLTSITTVLFMSFTLSIAQANDFEAYADRGGECLKKYRKSSKKKNDRYHSAYKRYQNNRISYAFNPTIAGAIVVQNSTVPRRDDYNIFEDDIIKSVDYDIYKHRGRNKPMVLEGIYNAAYETYSDVTYQKIQDLILQGFTTDRFCSIFGKSRVPRIQRYVLRELKKESKDAANERSPAVYDSSVNEKENLIQQNEELDKPVETKVNLE